ncbi:hypothetical protein [Allokutzneria oryzae]|uniref:Uncharacterized protein n=1 Tax=Allokutzneria oryzae TaxID=1378989 RepID=A0ABV5ZXM8_9PSEU
MAIEDHYVQQRAGSTARCFGGHLTGIVAPSPITALPVRGVRLPAAALAAMLVAGLGIVGGGPAVPAAVASFLVAAMLFRFGRNGDEWT